MNTPQPITTSLARFSLEERTFPAPAREAGVRSLVNILGCAFGGVDHPATELAYAVAKEFSGPATTMLIGRGRLVDGLNGAYLNCLATAAHAFDDTHLATVLHPSGPVAAALWALADREPISGRRFLEAFIIGVEVQCRVAIALLVAPARGQLGWYATGIAGGLGAAAASARVLGLSEERAAWALGLAANQASGFRQTHGTMCTSFVPAHAARSGLHSALLAARGFTATEAALEGTNGYFHVFAEQAHPAAALEGLGTRWHGVDNAFKPYPCGIVIHPALDACLEIAGEDGFDPDRVASVTLEVDPLCLTLCDRPDPTGSQLAQVSVQHWAAAALVRGRAGLAEGADECVRDPRVVEMRRLVRARPNADVGRAGAKVVVELTNAPRIERTVEHGIGSLERPMTNAELEAKFLAQAAPVLESDRAERLLAMAWDIESVDDVRELLHQSAPRGGA